MTVAHKAESEYEDRPGEGAKARLAQAEGDEIMTFREQIPQLQMVMQKPPMRTMYSNPGQFGSGNNENRNMNQARGNGNGWKCHKNVLAVS